MWFKKKKTEQIIIDINDIKNYVLENCEPNVKEIMFSKREKVSFSISDSKPVEEKVSFSISDSEPVEEKVSFSISEEKNDNIRYMLNLNKLDDIENVSKEKAAEKFDKVIKDSFSDVLVNYIIEKDVKNSYVYKKAQVDRKLFSKIISQKWYSPSKDTAISLAIALNLNLEETNHLIAKAGYTLSNSKKKDLIIAYFISKEIYDIDTINDTLYRLDERPLGRF